MRAVRAIVALGAAWAALGALPSAAARSETSTSTSSPPISIKLRGPWPVQPPLLLEALEAFASEEPESFFAFVTHMTGPWALATDGQSKAADAGLALAQTSPQQIYRAAHSQLDKHAYLSDAVARQSFNLSLALHSQAPRIEAFWQVYGSSGLERRWEDHVRSKASAGTSSSREACGSWVDWLGRVVCANDELRQALAAATDNKPMDPSPALLPFDHVLPAKLPAVADGADGAIYTAVLYADPFSSNFWDLHTTLFEHTIGSRSQGSDSSKPAPRLRYVLRWRPPVARLASRFSKANGESVSQETPSPREAPYTQQHSYLSSFGGALDLKKVDYLVIDDRKLKHSAETASEEASTRSPALLALEDRQREQEEQAYMHKILAGNDAAKDEGANTTAASLGDLTAEEIESLGMRASTLILQSTDPLVALRQLSHNFPTFGVALAQGYEARIAPGGTEDEVKSYDASQEILSRQGFAVQPGSSDLWLNGKGLSNSELWPLSLLDLLRKERQTIRALERIHPALNRTTAIDLLQYPHVSRAMSGGGTAGASGSAGEEGEPVFFDASDRLEKAALVTAKDDETEVQGPITYWNNIEKDDFYRRYSPNLHTLLRPAWPGSLPTVRRNLFNVIFVMDLRQRDTIRVVSETVAMNLPRLGIRWGFVPGALELDSDSVEGKESLQMARLYYLSYLTLDISQLTTMFLRLVGLSPKESFTQLKDMRSEVLAAFKHAGKKVPASPSDEEPAQDWAEYIDQVLYAGKVENVEKLIKAAKQYTERLRTTKRDNERGHLFVNGQHLPFSPTAMQMINSLINEQLQVLAKAVYRGQVDDDSDVDSFFYDREDSFSSRPALVFPAQESVTGSSAAPKVIDLLEATVDFKPHGEVVNSFVYPTAEVDGASAPSPNATVWLCGDLDTVRGAELIRKLLTMVTEARVRLGFVHQPSSASKSLQQDAAQPRLSTFLFGLISKDAAKHISPIELASIVDDYLETIPGDNLIPVGRIETSNDAGQKVLKPRNASGLLANFVKEAGWQLADTIEATAFWQQAGVFARRLDIKPRSFSLVVNGRVVAVPPEGVTEDDVRTLLKYEHSKRVAPIIQGLEHAGVALDELGRESYTDTVTLATSVLAKAFSDDGSDGGFKGGSDLRIDALERLPASDSSFELGNRDTATYRVVAMLNPLSERGQRIVGIIDMLSRLQGVWIKVIFNPEPLLTEIPLKRFYRFSAPHQLAFANDQEIPASLTFLDMPEEAVLTMGLEAPPAWLTMPEEAVYDLDNIRLKDVPAQDRRTGVSATYEIKHVLIEGHAQSDSRSPPRGLQLVLESPDGSEQLDTIVMANLAYFQFKARPGMFHLTVREGRSRDIYELESVGTHGVNSPNVSTTGNVVVLDSLNGLTILPRFGKRPGMEDEEVLESDIDKGLAEARKRKKSFFDQAKSAVSSMANKATSVIGSTGSNRTNAAINIFTVASGHLYERMTYIMILSVIKHTKSSVKFWFIENFLSPSFKEFIPHLAAEYGFQYELVTYAWPHWLRSQREKQRMIWGYKILFLDVLFPLDLDKVIFVDADQIVRTDMKELVDLDLHGAPYGYPPMGNDSYDMDNFRFWEQGYWKDFLRGKPYHISALYVVDLKRFREVAAGDILRGQYQALSADPNSLANLDQDLPNHLQHTVPIHTLDKTWLWCETWCSTDWLPQAKTIDLCSNPKTKEPKLDRARRQIPEWTVYDDEVAAFAQRLAEANRLGKNVVAPAEVERVGVQERIQEVGEAEGTSPPPAPTSTSVDGHHRDVVHDEL